MTAAVSVGDLCISYGERPIIDHFSIEVAPGEAVLIRGPSGCGKSTLLHAVCGLIPESIAAEMTGEVLLFGRPVRSLSRAEQAGMVGIVFQNPDTQLFCDTVEDEIAFGLENLCVPTDEMSAKIGEMLEFIRLDKMRQVSPKELSGGHKQLVVLASVLALSPRILLLDEAVSQLDTEGKNAVIKQIAALRANGQTLLIVDHDDAFAPLADREIILPEA